MAHEVETMAYAHQNVSDVPWHGLGTKVPYDLTPEQMANKAGVDWEVHKYPLYANVQIHGPNGTIVDKPIYAGKQALIRSSDAACLDVVGHDWNPVQNLEAFQFFNDFVSAGDMRMDTAGSLRNGKLVWALAKINDAFEVMSGDTVEGYLLFANPHQYGRSLEIRFTPIRVVCANTLAMAMSKTVSNRFSAGHRTKFDPDLAKEVLGISKQKLHDYEQMAKFLTTRRYNQETLEQYFMEAFPKYTKADGLSKNAERALEVMDTQPGANFGAGSWWQAVNAVTYLTDHEIGDTADSRISSAWFGDNARRKQRAVNLAMEMANAS